MFCKTCSTEKPSEDFYKSNKGRCKDCVCAAVRANRQANLERIRAYDKMRGSMPHRVAARKDYAQTISGKAAHARALTKQRLTNPEKTKARNAVSNALRDGRLRSQPCWCCGQKAEAHHPDYSRPLDVVWLCQPHHKQAHAIAEAA